MFGPAAEVHLRGCAAEWGPRGGCARDPAALAGWLWDEHRILVTTILHPQFSGLRISPSLYTTPAELARFVATLEHALTHGLTRRAR